MKSFSCFYLPIPTIYLRLYNITVIKCFLQLLYVNYIPTLPKNVLPELNGLSLKKEFTTHGDKVSRNAKIINKCKNSDFVKRSLKK